MSPEKQGVVVINIDLSLGTNLMDPHVSRYVKEIVRRAGPPCRTVSVARHREQEDGGPAPLRAREGEERFGLQSLTAHQREMTDNDTVLWLKNLYYMRLAKRYNEDVLLFLEQPRDPEAWIRNSRKPERGYPSFMVWPETVETMQVLQRDKVEKDQGCLGHSTVKPSTFYTNAEGVKGQGLGHRGATGTLSAHLEGRFAGVLC